MRSARNRQGNGRPGRVLGLALLVCLGLARAGFPQTVDCILAMVNGQAVSLSDVKILDAFGFFPGDASRPEGERLRAILDKVIDRKIVIDIAQEQVLISPEKVEAALRDLEARQPAADLSRKLEALGLTSDDLKPYVEDMLLEQEIVKLRFGRSVSVTLKEIEDYYHQAYIPGQKSLGREPQPLLQVLSEVEDLLKKDKIEAQAETWIKNLRRQGSVRIKNDCLNNLKEE